MDFKTFMKRQFCMHANWSNKTFEFGRNILSLKETLKIRRSKPWPYGTGENTYFCIACGKIKDFGWMDNLGYFSSPNIPINYNFNLDLFD